MSASSFATIRMHLPNAGASLLQLQLYPNHLQPLVLHLRQHRRYIPVCLPNQQKLQAGLCAEV